MKSMNAHLARELAKRGYGTHEIYTLFHDAAVAFAIERREEQTENLEIERAAKAGVRDGTQEVWNPSGKRAVR